MAAVIFLGCEQRYITPDAKLMFHNLSIYKHTIPGLKRDYFDYIREQLNISQHEMFRQFQPDYYLYGSDIIKKIPKTLKKGIIIIVKINTDTIYVQPSV